MSNMSHCRFRNTRDDLLDCLDNLGADLCKDEADARKELIQICEDVISDARNLGLMEDAQ